MSAPAVLFDLDDTLADTAGTILRPAEEAAVRAMLAAGLRSDFPAAHRELRRIRERDPAAPFCEQLVATCGAPDPRACARAGRLAFFGTPVESLRLRAGAREVLARLSRSGCRLFLVTFGRLETQWAKVRHLGLEDAFEQVLVVDLLAGPGKAAAFRRLLADRGLDPARTWVVGDRLPGEIRAGNELGLTTVRVRGGEFGGLVPRCAEETPDHEIDALPELLRLLDTTRD